MLVSGGVSQTPFTSGGMTAWMSRDSLGFASLDLLIQSSSIDEWDWGDCWQANIDSVVFFVSGGAMKEKKEKKEKDKDGPQLSFCWAGFVLHGVWVQNQMEFESWMRKPRHPNVYWCSMLRDVWGVWCLGATVDGWNPAPPRMYETL